MGALVLFDVAAIHRTSRKIAWSMTVEAPSAAYAIARACLPHEMIEDFAREASPLLGEEWSLTCAHPLDGDQFDVEATPLPDSEA